MIKVGDKIPAVNLRQVTDSGVQDIDAQDFFRGKRVALFGVPGLQRSNPLDTDVRA